VTWAVVTWTYGAVPTRGCHSPFDRPETRIGATFGSTLQRAEILPRGPSRPMVTVLAWSLDNGGAPPVA
jgi:hypothetical protein